MRHLIILEDRFPAFLQCEKAGAQRQFCCASAFCGLPSIFLDFPGHSATEKILCSRDCTEWLDFQSTYTLHFEKEYTRINITF